MGPWFRKQTETEDVNGATRLVVHKKCVGIKSSDEFVNPDIKWSGVRALTLAAGAIGGLATMVMMLGMCCFRQLLGTRLFTGIFLLVLPILQAMSFLLLQSNACSSNPFVDDPPEMVDEQVYSLLLSSVYSDKCEWGLGMTLNAVSVVCWFLTGLTFCCVGERRRGRAVSNDTQERKQSKKRAMAEKVDEEDDPETGMFCAGWF